MAVGRYYRKKRSKRQNEQSLCRCVVTVLQVAVLCQNVSSITAQDFIQSRFEADVINERSSSSTQSKVSTDANTRSRLNPNERVTSQADVVRFDPPFLDFDAQPIGIPSMRIVHIYNPSKTNSLKLNAISARTSHFHSSFFDKKHVPPGGNASFEVVFLARVIGNVENTLFINAVSGTFSYQVFGVGTPNPYRLRPFLGAKVSVNSTFSPLITIHNPTGTPLQVTEMYTSSGYLHLQLPTGVDKGRKQLWEIPPYESRPVMQASFFGQVVDNHTAFIRIRTNRTGSAQNLILPLEVEVTTAPGIYSSLEMLDFGTLRSNDQPKTLNVFLLNSGAKEVMIGSIAVHPPNPAMLVDFRPIKLEPSEALFTSVANISFDVRKVRNEDQWSGKVVIRSKEKSYAELSLSYQVNILDGNLGYDEDRTFFHVPAAPEKNFTKLKAQNITNTFAFPVILHKLELPDSTSNFFQVANFSSPCTVPARGSASCFSIECLSPSFQSLSTDRIDALGSTHHVILHTNASTFSMPLHAFTGLLATKVQNGNLANLDFGIMGTLDKRQLLLTLINRNPVEVALFDFNSSLSGIDVNVIALSKDGSPFEDYDARSLTRNILLPAGSHFTLEVVLSAPKTETFMMGNLTFYTNYETLIIPIKARIAIGSLTLKPAKFKFRPSFPGMVVHQTLSVTSSFAQTMKIESLSCQDKRFYYRKHKNIGSELEPGKELKIGKVYFDARLNCKPGRCYVGLPTSTTVGHHWLSTLNLGKNAAEVDPKLYKSHQDQWKKLKEQNMTSISSNFQLSTNLVRSFDVETSAVLYWPSLVAEPVYEYPLTHIGKKSTTRVSLHNPSDLPVIVQILPISFYPQPRVALEALGKEELLEEEGFTVSNSTTFNVSLSSNASSQGNSQMMWLEYTLNGKTNKSCVNLFLNPGQTQTIDVTFLPFNASPVSTLILIRNNLTVLDAFEVKGRGVKEMLKLGGKLSNEKNSSLKFKLTESLLRDCFVKNRKDKMSPSYTVRKSFTAKNIGLLQLQVRYMMIDNFPCEGYGFRILDCHAFVLQPNETKDLIIVYTPDFTTSQVSHILRIWTSQGNILTFKLNVTLPHHLLPACQASIPRPQWELPLYYCFVVLTLVGLIGILLISYLEAMNILQPYHVEYGGHRGAQHGYPGMRKTFNLNDIVAMDEMTDGNHVTLGKPSSKERKKNFNSIKSMARKLIAASRNFFFDAMRYLKKPSDKPDDVELREPSMVDLMDASKHLVPKSQPSEQTVAPLVSSNTGARNRSKQNRKTKSNSGSPNQTNNVCLKVKSEVEADAKTTSAPVFSTPLSWTIISASKSTTNSVHKLGDDKLDAGASATSSVDSSRSRGSSVSSRSADSERRKSSDDDDGIVPLRKTKSTRSLTSSSRDCDDTSSISTEKSSEDFEDNRIFNNNHIRKVASETTPNHRTVKSKLSNDNSKGSSDSDYKETDSIPISFPIHHDTALRHRHPRPKTSNLPRKEPTARKTTYHQPPLYYSPCNAVTPNEEPTWDFPTITINKREADEVLLAISEKTRQLDGKIRSLPSSKVERNYGNSNQVSPFGSVASFNMTAYPQQTTKAQFQPPSTTSSSIKPNLTKAQSMPESISPPRFSNLSDLPLAGDRRNSSNENREVAPFCETPITLSNPATVNSSTWNAFGRGTFTLAEDFMPPGTVALPSPPQPSTPLNTSQWHNSSVFTLSPSTSTWSRDNTLQLNLSPPPTRTPTSSPLNPASSALTESNPWNSSPSLPRSTHEIWSVMNAVTMDEDRSTAENDPLGLKRIWNEDPFDARNNSLF